MMRFVLLAYICLSIAAPAFASDYSAYAAKNYEECCGKKVKITVKKEHVEKLGQEVGGKFIPYIAYGYGDMKVVKERKKRISYICLLDENCQPFWSCIFPTCKNNNAN